MQLQIWYYLCVLNCSSDFEIQVLSTSAIKSQGNFRIFRFASVICWQKSCQRLSRNLCIFRQQWLRHTSAFCAKGYGLIFKQSYYLLYLNYIVNFITGETEDSIPLVDHFVLLSLCVLAIVGEHIQC